MIYPLCFSSLLISLSYITWDFFNIGTLSVILQSKIVSDFLFIIIILIGILKSINYLKYIDIRKSFISFFVIYIIILVFVFLLPKNLMKKDISLYLCWLYITYLFTIIIPVHGKKEIRLQLRLLIAFIFVILGFIIYSYCFNIHSCKIELAIYLFCISVGGFYFISYLLLFIIRKLGNCNRMI